MPGVVIELKAVDQFAEWCGELAAAGFDATLEEELDGSAEFVGRWIAGLGDKFPAAHVCARAVGEIGFASHGWRIAEKAKSGGVKVSQEEPIRE